MGFSIIEDFIRARIGEIFTRIGESNIPFDDLPDKLREASVYKAVRALAYHGDIRKRQGDDFIAFIQEHSRNIGSTMSSGYLLSNLSVEWDRANLSDEEVKGALAALKIKDAWGNVDQIAARVGVSAPSLREAFKQAASRRHRAAHSADADTEISLLSSFVPQAVGIAIGVDALASRSLRYLLDRNAGFMADGGEVSAANVPIRLVRPTNGRWKEFREGSQRAVAVNVNKDEAIAACLARPAAHDDLVVVLDERDQPSDWFLPNTQ